MKESTRPLPNLLLAQLDQASLNRLEPRQVRLQAAIKVATAGGIPQLVIFPLRGTILAAWTEIGGKAGPPSLIDHARLLLARQALPATLNVLVPGEAIVVEARALRDVQQDHYELNDALARGQDLFLAEAMQQVACTAGHAVEARMANLLRRLFETTGQTTLSLTQATLAALLAIPRTSASSAAAMLQRAGAIEVRRGDVKLLSDELLRAGACSCGEALALHRNRLFGKNV